ncbi:cytochrome P450 [Cryptosporangium sp. NPDC051539]|uniref:cytochrome P450 n=1 Tax=Cryptosporangium sp. NPDC051539 TaxID=3363962 RepID=UPI003793E71F
MSTDNVVRPPFTLAEFLDSWDEESPQRAFSELARGDLRRRPDDGTEVLASRAEIVEFLRHPAVRATDGVHYNMGAQRPLIPLDLDGDRHRFYRRLLDPLFSPRNVAYLESRIRTRTSALIDEFIEAGEAELMEALCGPLPSLIFIDLLGLPLEDLPVFLDFKEAVVRPHGATLAEQREYMNRAGQVTYDYLVSELARRRAKPSTDDLIGGFLTTTVDGRTLTDEEIVDICYLLVIAGIDTVTSSLSCQLAWLAKHPAERARIVADESLLGRAVEEIQRFESPVPLAHRWVAEDITINGRAFAAGTTVEVLWAAANVDPANFDDPLTVDFDRPHNNHVGFAAGPHRCLGTNLARLELRVALSEFHRRIPDYRIAPGNTVVWINYGVRAALSLPIVFTPDRFAPRNGGSQ